MVMKGSVIGILSGIILGALLKWFEAVTSVKIYTLLLNVDFIPIVGNYIWPEWIEFIFHLIISIIIGIIFLVILNKIGNTVKNQFFVAFALTIPTIFLYFPLAALAIKDVPAPLNGFAFTLWTIGHLGYALSIPLVCWLLDKRTT
ncbi:hypothetical protein E2R51_05470 [Jeotgalibacillus sp. S-D1]|uniref:hypothetical protein n=1 Tax=Jeotgalibacillus sp. S-D1 TaxID=2552189 RepID=UPI00105A9D84|nr:hypothetical protein [Jeotgalibacillus sp. S-D1]TDL35168.1 hypothetical protein E2R51_05470 [Jeotgalibacillus sp. S-D1]